MDVSDVPDFSTVDGVETQLCAGRVELLFAVRVAAANCFRQVMGDLVNGFSVVNVSGKVLYCFRNVLGSEVPAGCTVVHFLVFAGNTV